MDKVYNIFLDEKLIGRTAFEHADAPMGVVFGKIRFVDIANPFDFLKSYCIENNIEFEEHPEDKLISTMTIPSLRITSESGQEIKGGGNQISGMDAESYDVTVLGISYPFYGDEFPNHVKNYEKRF